MAVCAGLSACSQPEPPGSTHLNVPDASANQAESLRVIEGAAVAASARSTLAHAIHQAEALTVSIQTMLQAPDAVALKTAQQHLLSAYHAFLVFRAFSYLPISDPQEWRQQGVDAASTLLLLDSWPVTGGYIDAVPGYPVSGIVNDLTLEITPATLLSQHGFSSEYDISLGFHAIDFLLRGEDGHRTSADFRVPEPTSNADTTQAVSSPPAMDEHLDDELTRQTGVMNHQRRRTYLQVATRLLLSHLERLERRWKAGGHYTMTLEKSEPSRVLFAVKVAARQTMIHEILDKRLSQPEWDLDKRSELDALNQGIEQLIALADTVLPELNAWHEPKSMLLNEAAPTGADQAEAEMPNTSSASLPDAALLESPALNLRETLSQQAQRRLALLVQ